MMPSVEKPTTSPSTSQHYLRLLNIWPFVQMILPGFVELSGHRGVATSKPLDGEVVSLVVGKAQIVL